MYERAELKNPDFQESSLQKPIMFFHVLQEHFYFALFDQESKKFQNVVTYKAGNPIAKLQPEELLDNMQELSFKAGKKIMAFSSPKISILPKELMEKDISIDVMKLNFDIAEDETIGYNEIQELDSVMLFSKAKSLKHIETAFNPDKIVHASGCFLKSVLSKRFYSDSKDMFIDLEEQFFKVLVILNKELVLFNSFPFKSGEDILYHLMNIGRTFEFDPHKDNYHFSGLLDINSTTYKLLHKYIQYPFFTRKPDNFLYSRALDHASVHPFFNLFSIALCV